MDDIELVAGTNWMREDHDRALGNVMWKPSPSSGLINAEKKKRKR